MNRLCHECLYRSISHDTSQSEKPSMLNASQHDSIFTCTCKFQISNTSKETADIAFTIMTCSHTMLSTIHYYTQYYMS